MRISCPSHHVWYKFIAEDPLLQFGKNNRRKLRAALAQLSSCGISVTEEPVEEMLSWFLPLYKERVAEKDHPLSIDITQAVVQNRIFPFHALCLYENGMPLGAMLYTIRNNKISIAYRTFAHTWHNAKLPASPSLLMEYMICTQAQAYGKRALTHGKDRNPYGIYSDIGLCAFKLSSGCKARLPKNYSIQTIETDEVTQDVLVLGLPQKGKRITRAYLLAKQDSLDRYAQLCAYPELLFVEVVLRN
jgi:hypothetical protein